MKTLRILLGLCLGTLLTACATGPKVAYVPPRVTIAGMSVEQAKMRLIPPCVETGGTIEENSPHQLICAKPFDDSFGSMMYRALLTPSYSTNPSVYVRYSFVDAGGQLYIAVDTYVQNQTAFGRVDRQPIQNGAIAAQAQSFLDRIKADHTAALASNGDVPAPTAIPSAIQAEGPVIGTQVQNPDPAKRVPAMQYQPRLP